MADLVFILLSVAFFALAYAYIAGCARILGPEVSTGEPLVDAELRSQVPR